MHEAEPKGALSRFIRWVMRDTTYHASYPATVQSQSADDSLDLLPDDERVRGTGLSSVPIRHGLPGVRVRVAVGARVLLGFEAGDPRRPYAGLWEPGSIEEILFDGGTAPVARQGDAVQVFWPTPLTAGGSATIGGQAFVGTLIVTGPSAGVIQTGAARVKA